MAGIFKKLQLKDQNPILIYHYPEEFNSILRELDSSVVIHHEVENGRKYGFMLVFVNSCDQIGKYASEVLGHTEEDGLVWFSYPKKSSKIYKTDISRDDGWTPLGNAGYEPVRQVAIDEDWSALRFRETKYIKSMKRDQNRAMSTEGKKRTEEP